MTLDYLQRKMKDLYQSIQKKLYQRPESELISVEENLMQAFSGGGGDAGGWGGGEDLGDDEDGSGGREHEFEEDLDFESRMLKLHDMTPFIKIYKNRRESTEE